MQLIREHRRIDEIITSKGIMTKPEIITISKRGIH
jgi:hypothetical protein